MQETNELALNFALKSHPGRIRPLNEDAVGADPGIGLFILADGLGGYNAGEVASTMTVSASGAQTSAPSSVTVGLEMCRTSPARDTIS